MSNIGAITKSTMMMSSLEISQLIDARHDNVKRQ